MRKYRIENYGIYSHIFDVQMKVCGIWVTIKTFKASLLEDVYYAEACAQELLDKLREELL